LRKIAKNLTDVSRKLKNMSFFNGQQKMESGSWRIPPD
jgi:hypothetical protein